MGCTADDVVDCVGAGAGAGEAEVVSALGVDSGSDAAVSSAAAGAAAGGCSTSMV